MDSRLLNAYHDDPYECYESNITDIWSTDNIEMELEHTLDGILPIRATEVENETFCNVFYTDERVFHDKEHNSNALVYNDFDEVQVQQLNAVEGVDTIDTIVEKHNRNANTLEVDLFDAVKIIQDDDAKSLYSNASFRTRTDSSSIGDYESHSSDYDDIDEYYGEDDDINDNNVVGDDALDSDDDDVADDCEIDAALDNVAIEALETDDILTDLPGLNFLNGEQFMFIANGVKQRTISTNTIGSDVDAANFDLAEFITKDDDLLATKTTTAASVKKAPAPVAAVKTTTTFVQPTQSKKVKITKFDAENIADSDSDVIVDVETVEFEDITKKRVLLMKRDAASEITEDNLAFVDNIKTDPEWNPKEIKSKCIKALGTTSSPTSKKICDSSRNGKLKKINASMQNFNKTTTINNNKKQILKSTQTNVQNTSYNRHGIGKGGKNLALLKRDCESIEPDESANCKEGAKLKDKDIALFKHDSNSIDGSKQQNNNNNQNNANNNCNNVESNLKAKINVETEKRKLNLDEYKQRRNGGEDLKNVANKAGTNEFKTKTITATQITTKPTTTAKQKPNLSPIKVCKPHSEAVTSIVKTLKEQQQLQQQQQQQHDNKNNQTIDPITLARNKVLRMQELKRAQQMKIIDSTISAKVPRVTKLLPLQEIIKGTAYAVNTEKHDKRKANNNDDAVFDNHPDYEKIVMVSVACNTALTLSPRDHLPTVPMLENIKSRATAEQIKISNNSLITSIQDAVVKQSLPKVKVNGAVDEGKQTTDEQNRQQQQQQQHGEDKIIMHLRKDRIRENNKCSIEIQTDFQAAFPTLPLPKHLRKLRQSRRKYRKHDMSTMAAEFTASSGMESSHSDIEQNIDAGGVAGCVTTVAATIDYQNSEHSVGVNTAGSIAGYSSRSSSRRHRSSMSSSYSESGQQQQRSSRSSRRKSNYRKNLRKTSRDLSSSSSSSLSDYSDRSRSRSRRSRSRSRSPFYGSSNTRRENNYADRNVSKPAVEERRIVYVGRIEEETSKEMLRRKFLAYGSIRQITIHYKENGMKYGFVTFERSEDAFAVIDGSARDNQINMYDISFGGRRAFCRTSYADLDNAGINNYHSYVFPKAPAPPKQEDSFEALLKKVKAKLDASKTAPAASQEKL